MIRKDLYVYLLKNSYHTLITLSPYLVKLIMFDCILLLLNSQVK